MKIIETPIFTRRLKDILDDEDYRELQNYIIANPYSGKVIPHSSGLRKLRWSGSGRGKRGGSRIIYYNLENHLLRRWLCSYGYAIYTY